MRSLKFGFVALTALGLAAPIARAADAKANNTAVADSSAKIPTIDFARHARIMSPRLSPGGDYLSVRMDDASGDQHALMVYRLKDMSVASILRMPKYELPVNTTWVSDTRLVVAKGRAYGSLGEPQATGELIATDVDGKHQAYLYGYKQVGRRALTRNNDRGFGEVDSLPLTPNGHFYMSARPWDNPNLSTLYDVDAVHNTRKLVADMKLYGMNFFVDPDGKAAFAYGVDANMDFRAFRRAGNTWQAMKFADPAARFEPVAYTPDHKRIYAFYTADGGPLSLVSENLDGTGRKVLVKGDFGSAGDIQWTAPPLRPFAAGTLGGKPSVKLLDPNLYDAKIYAKLTTLFPGEFVNFINFSQDGGKLLFSVASDRDPGTYYVLDTKTLKVAKLFVVLPWIKPAQMPERRPIRFKASDGLELAGYLTLPQHHALKNLPLVLMPHGGPHGIRDNWFWDRDAAFLASRGYLVLQVNYRGSSGRGDHFMQSGYMKWGTRIQQDLIDGVKWAIAQHYADPKRVCVYGASFGGYSAMMSVIRAPGLFKCAIGYAGIYDLEMMYHKGDIRMTESGRNYLKTVIGDDEATLDANSPDKLAAKIKVPVLLIHGKDDKRAPYAQAKAMREALTEAGNPPQWLVKSNEGHGFYDVNNVVEQLDTVAAFLDRNIGKGAASAK